MYVHMHVCVRVCVQAQVVWWACGEARENSLESVFLAPCRNQGLNSDHEACTQVSPPSHLLLPFHKFGTSLIFSRLQKLPKPQLHRIFSIASLSTTPAFCGLSEQGFQLLCSHPACSEHPSNGRSGELKVL